VVVSPVSSRRQGMSREKMGLAWKNMQNVLAQGRVCVVLTKDFTWGISFPISLPPNRTLLYSSIV
jgi:hypothetical protein